MTPENPTDPRQALEVSLTALLLDELPPDQAEFLRGVLAHDAELARMYERLKQTIALVQATEAEPAVVTPAAAPEPLRLSEEKREALLERFKTVAPVEFEEAHGQGEEWKLESPPRRQTGMSALRSRYSWVLMAAAVVVIGGVVLSLSLPSMNAFKPYDLAGRNDVSLGFGTWGLKEEATAPPAEATAQREEFAKRRIAAVPISDSRGQSASEFAALGRRADGGVNGTDSLDKLLTAKPSAGAEIVLPHNLTLNFNSDADMVDSGAASAERPGDATFTTEGVPSVPAFTPAAPAVVPPNQPTEPNLAIRPMQQGGMAGSGVRGGGMMGGGGGAGFGGGGAPVANQPEAAEAAARMGRRYGLARKQDQPAGPELAAKLDNVANGVEPMDADSPQRLSRSRLQEGLRNSGDGGGAVATVDPSTGLPVAQLADSSGLITSGLTLSKGSAATEQEITLFSRGAPVQTNSFGFGQTPVTNSSGTVQNGDLAAGYFAWSESDTANREKYSGASTEGRAALGDRGITAGLRGFYDDGLSIAESESRGRGDASLGKTPALGDGPVVGRFFQSEAGGREIRKELEQAQTEQQLRFDDSEAAATLADGRNERWFAGRSSIVLPGKPADDTSKGIPMGVPLAVEEKVRAEILKDASPAEDTASYSMNTMGYNWSIKALPKSGVAKNPEQIQDQDSRQTKETALALVQDGKQLLEMGKLSDAKTKLKEAVKADPQNQNAHYYLNLASEAEYRNKQSARDHDSHERLVQIEKAWAKPVDKKRVEALHEKTQAFEPDPNPVKATTPPAVPQPEIQSGENAFSTFSLNVSDVSFKLAAASLEKGTLPEPASIRSEEFINAFDYRDPEAPPGMPIAFAWERSRYPFAQNRDLLRFSVKTAAQGRQPGRPLNLVLLLDNSGSMERADRVAIIREGLKVLAAQLRPDDKLSVITFSRTPRLWVDGVSGSQAAKVADEVAGLTPQGGTNLEEAMNLAYQTALRHYQAAGVNRVVLLTDGAANLGDVEPETLKQKVESHRKQGIALDCFGIGWEGYNDDLLEVLSRNGDGRYGFINTPEEACTEFVGQLAGALQVAASDVKVQVEFNPQRVVAYRQIGYAKHQLTKEQFRDNTVDAAEIGAAESGNALYVIEVNPRGQGALGTVRVRFKVPGTSDYREHEWTVPYNGSAVPLEHASFALRLAGSSSAFSEWLAASPYAGGVSLDALLYNLRGVPEVYGADARPKKLEWMIRQARSLTGK